MDETKTSWAERRAAARASWEQLIGEWIKECGLALGLLADEIIKRLWLSGASRFTDLTRGVIAR